MAERKAERGVYWRQLLNELKQAPEELKKELEHIKNQKKTCLVGMEARTQSAQCALARNRR
jgi:hypothetical protein